MALVPHLHACRIYQSEMTNGVQCNGNSMMISLRPKAEVAGCWSFVRRQQGLRWDFPGLKRGRQVTVAASPPAEDTTVLTEPLTKKDLVDYLASGCKQKEQWRIGTEHEKFGFEVETLRPISYEQIAALLNGIAERFEWDKIMEENHVIGLKQGKQSISLEPGGQFELSGAPLETLHQTCAEVNSHLYQVKAVAEEMGIGFLGIGFQPKWPLKDIPIMPKGRYEIMRNYMPKVGSLGLDMMFRTCTVQVNLDFSSESDMIRKFRAGLALQPIATAIFANSPFTEGKPNGFLSMRSHIWTDTDNDRAGMLPFVFDDSFGFEAYVDYALDVPMYFVYRKKKYIDCSGMSFRDFLYGKLPAIPGELPTLVDWENHLTTIFPEVRLKRYLEMRGADGGPWRRLCALPAFWGFMLESAGSGGSRSNKEAGPASQQSAGVIAPSSLSFLACSSKEPTLPPKGKAPPISILSSIIYLLFVYLLRVSFGLFLILDSYSR